VENKNLYLYVDSVGRKIKSANLTINQYSTNNVFHFITVGKFDNVTATFRDPSGSLSSKYHLLLSGKYELKETDTEPILIDNADNLWEYILNPIAKRVTAIDVTATTARLSVSFSAYAYNQSTQILQEAMVASTTIVVNRADQSEVFDESYNSEDVNNLWAVLNERVAISSTDEERLEDIEEELASHDTSIRNLTNSVNTINNTTIPNIENEITGKVSKTGDTMLGNLGLLSASMNQGGMIITSDDAQTPEISFTDPLRAHKFTLSGSGDGFYPENSNTESLGSNSHTWKDLYIAGNISNGIKSMSVANIVDVASNQTITGAKKFNTVPTLDASRTISSNNQIVDAKYVQDQIVETVGDISDMEAEISAIQEVIPNEASISNKLADKAYVNSTINSQAAFFKGSFDTQLTLLAQPWQTSNPSGSYYVSNNDYAYVSEVVAGSSIGNWNPNDHLGEAWRFIYVTGTGWQPQFMVNDSPFTQAQLDAINSGITASLVADMVTEDELPTKTSDLTNDSGYITNATAQIPATQITGLPAAISANIGNVAYLTDEADVIALGNSLGNISSLDWNNDPLFIGNSLTIDLSGSLSGHAPDANNQYANRGLVIASPKTRSFATLQDTTSNIIYSIKAPSNSISNKTCSLYLPDFTDITSGTLALESQIPTKTSDLINDAGFLTDVNIPTKTSDLVNDSGYITSAILPTKTSDLTNDSGFITSSALQPYALSSSVPTKTSDLTNDSGYITNANIPTKTSDLVNDSGFLTSANIPTKTSDLTNDSGFITANDIPAIPTATSDLTNDSGFITSSALSGYAQTANLATVATSGSYNDLSNKPSIPTQVSDLTNDSDFQTDTEVSDAITSALNGYATETYVDTAISGLGSVFTIKGSVPTVSALPASGNTIGDVYYVEAKHSGYVWIEIDNVPQWEQLGETIDLSNYALLSDLTWNNITDKPTFATVATSGDYDDLSNKPTFATVATSGSYNDLTDKPTIPSTTYMVTTNAAQDITGEKTFKTNPIKVVNANKGIQLLSGTNGSNNAKLGFTLYNGSTNSSAYECGFLEGNSTNRDVMLGYYNQNGRTTEINRDWKVGFAYQGYYGTTTDSYSAYKLVVPNRYNLKNYNTYRYIPIDFTDGTTTVRADNTGVVDLSSLITAGGGGATYTAGTGIDITNDVISVDNTIATKSEIPTNTNQLTNGAGFITSSALSDYALSSSIPTDLGDLSNNAGYALAANIPTNNNQLTNGAGYITNAALADYALASSVPNIPTTSTANKVLLSTSTAGTAQWSTSAIGNAAYKTYTSSVSAGSADLITSGAVAASLANKQDASTAYNRSNIVYSATEPSNPTLGMIWLKPIE